MIKNHIEDIKTVISDTMSKYIFEHINDETAIKIKKEVAMKLDAKDYYDYHLDVEALEDDIILKMNVVDVTRNQNTKIYASYTECPPIITTSSTNDDTLETNKNVAAFDKAMEIV